MNAKLQMIASMALFGTLSLFIRNIPLASAEIALFRAAIALACLLAARRLGGRGARLRRMGRDLPLLLLSGAALGFNWIFLFEAYRYTTVSVATLSYYFAPVLVMALSPALFHERVTARQIACFAGAAAGLAMVVNAGGLSAGGDHLRGVGFGLAAAALYAAVVLMNKGIRQVSGLDRAALQFAAAALVLLPYVLATTGVRLGGMTPTGWLCLLCVGALHSGVAYALYFSALRTLPGQEAAILSYVDPLVAVAVSLIAFREPVTATQAAGGALILACTLLNELKLTKR